MIKVEINYQIKTPQKYEALFQKIAEKTCQVLKISQLNLSVAMVKPLIIKELNKRYRHLNEVTDVLSFAGVNEIIICLAQAKKQSRELKKTLNYEVAFLFLHGLLHLFGYDHQTKPQKQKMDTLAEKILNNVVLRR